MSFEGGVTLTEAMLNVALALGNTQARQRGSGHSVVPRAHLISGRRTGVICRCESGRGGRQTMRFRAVCGPALKVSVPWEGLPPANGAEPRPEPDSGNPTVRDRRGACGNANYGGTVNPPRISKERGWKPSHLWLRAPHFYPDYRYG